MKKEDVVAGKVKREIAGKVDVEVVVAGMV